MLVFAELEVAVIRAKLEASRHVVIVTAESLRTALGRQRSSKHLEHEANKALLRPAGLGGRALGKTGDPVRKNTPFVLYLVDSLVGRLIDEGQMPPHSAFSPIASDVAALERGLHGEPDAPEDSSAG